MTWSVAACAVLACLAAYAAPAAGLGNLADTVLQKGADARLPPNLSLVLGIGTGEALAVKQAVLREGAEVRVFNVCVANPQDIVMLHTNEHERTTRAFLLSRDGKLRKAVAFRAGGPPRVTPPAQAKAGFAAELKFWTDYLRRP
ncbi:MAG: hypothetical protein ACRETH_11400 [Steroidobacteraceae bacterium]